MAENNTEAAENNTKAKGGDPRTTDPLAYRLVVTAILCVSILFIVVMVFFGWRGVFKEDAQVVAALTSAFAVIGTLVGAYFGIKSSSDARDQVKDVHDSTATSLQETTGALRQVTGVAERAQGAAETATSKAEHVTQRADRLEQQLAEKADREPNGDQQVRPPNGAPDQG